MSAPGRWIRMDSGAFRSEWLAPLVAESQHGWTRLLLYVKESGVGGSAKRLGPAAIEKEWGITALRFADMENAAIADGALVIKDGWWVVTGWNRYQKPDRTNSMRQKKFREKPKPTGNGVMPRYDGVTRRVTETVTETNTTTSLVVRLKSIYPKRPGGQNWSKAEKSIRGHIKEGDDPEAIFAGTERYAKYMADAGKAGTDWVKQASTFFGPDRHWTEDYTTNGNGPDKPKAFLPGSAARVL